MADEIKKTGFDPKAVQVGGESFLERLLPHIKKIVVACIGIAVVLAVVFTVRYFKQKHREADTEQVAQILFVGDKPVRTAEDKVDDKDKDDSFASPKERATTTLDAMTKHDDKDVAPAYRAGLLFDAGKYDEALAAYQACATVPGLDGVACREGVGIAPEAKAATQTDAAARNKGYEAALAAFKAEQPDDNGPRAAYAHYHQGRMLFQLHKLDDARKEFEKARDLGKETLDLPELTKKRLAVLGA
jgi:hypothetical protein